MGKSETAWKWLLEGLARIAKLLPIIFWNFLYYWNHRAILKWDTDWKSVCRWFNSTSGHRLIISDISILSYIILVWFEELNKFYKVLQAEYWAINPQPSSTLVLQNASTPTTPTGYSSTLLFWERYYPQKNYPGNQLLQEYGKLWRVSYLRRISGVYLQEMISLTFFK